MREKEFALSCKLLVLSDGEIPIKEVNVAALISLLKGHKFTVSQVCYATI